MSPLLPHYPLPVMARNQMRLLLTQHLPPAQLLAALLSLSPLLARIFWLGKKVQPSPLPVMERHQIRLPLTPHLLPRPALLLSRPLLGPLLALLLSSRRPVLSFHGVRNLCAYTAHAAEITPAESLGVGTTVIFSRMRATLSPGDIKRIYIAA